MRTQIFHHPKIQSSKKKSSTRNQNPSRYYNSIINQSQVFQHKAKIYHVSKILKIKIDLLLLPSMGQNPLSYYTL
jgi:hypothetical protein